LTAIRLGAKITKRSSAVLWKPAILITLSVFLFNTFSFAQSDAYKERLSGIIEEAQALEGFLKSTALSYSDYDKWYKEFKKPSEEFQKDFIREYKQKESFKAAKEAINSLSLAWADLNQANYAEEQYKEYITSSQVAEAHRWKSKAIDLRKKATEEISQALENFNSSGESLKEE
jgi:hypothetical protein